jgi:hypothetical protein
MVPDNCTRCNHTLVGDDAALLPDGRAICTRCVTTLLEWESRVLEQWPGI